MWRGVSVNHCREFNCLTGGNFSWFLSWCVLSKFIGSENDRIYVSDFIVILGVIAARIRKEIMISRSKPAGYRATI